LNSPKVSVLTPVYNGERFLRECIESVLAQSFEDWEYLILDNASTDSTPDIIKSYAEKEPRIRYQRNEHTLPIMENWNTAMRLINPASEYCKVIHADDTLFPRCLEEMVAVADAHPTTSLIGAYRIDGAGVNMISIPYPTDMVPGKELARRRLLGEWQDLFGSPSSVMYRADEVRKRANFYNPDNLHADTEVCFELLRDGDYGFVHQVLTQTRRHGGSETTEMRQTGTHSAARLEIACRYGPDFLEPAEQRFAIKLQLGFHYDFLGANIGKFRDPEFRRYHVAVLEECGVPLSYFRLVLATMKASAKRFRRKVVAGLCKQ
jgi:glycosyltransferase involved in cell wall biosynthesis